MPLERLGVELHLAGGELAEVGEEDEPLGGRVQLRSHLRHHHCLNVVHLQKNMIGARILHIEMHTQNQNGK